MSGRRLGKSLVKPLLTAMLAAGTLPLIPSPAAAAIRVDTTADGYGTGPGCTLREAIHAANANNFFDYCDTGVPGLDVITLPAGTYGLTVAGDNENAGETGDLDVTERIKIRGAGMGKTIIDATGLGDRVLDVIGNTSVTLKDVTIQGGDAGVSGGGGVSMGTGGALTLERVRVRNNAASAGGGLYVPSSLLTVRHSIISGNDADGNLNGAGIYHQASAALTIEDSTIADNVGATACGSPGGGLVTYSDDGRISRSLLEGNSTNCGGEAFFNLATLTVTDSTVSGNTGPSPTQARSDGTLTLIRTTVRGDGGIRDFGSLSITGSVLDTDPDTTCNATSYVSGGANVFNDAGCGALGPGDKINTNPRLAPLANNGGPTRTHALKKASPARNLVPKADCGPADQRGAPRKGSCDAGAYEYTICAGVVVNRVGTPTKDVLVGTAKRDGFLTLGGNDTARGKGGNDAFCLGGGKDRGYGGGGHDVLLGQGGNDLLKGQAGNDRLNGGPGKKDRCIQGPGAGPLRGCELT